MFLYRTDYLIYFTKETLVLKTFPLIIETSVFKSCYWFQQEIGMEFCGEQNWSIQSLPTSILEWFQLAWLESQGISLIAHQKRQHSCGLLWFRNKAQSYISKGLTLRWLSQKLLHTLAPFQVFLQTLQLWSVGLKWPVQGSTAEGTAGLFLCWTHVTTARPHSRNRLAAQSLLYLIKDTGLHVFTKGFLKFLEENWLLPFTDMT